MRRVQRKRPIDFILPFLVILGIGVIGVLAFQLWQSFEKQGKEDVYFYLVEGKAKVLPFGRTEWDNAFSGTKLLIGDSLKTTSTGKAVMQFFNGTIIRLGPDTAVSLTDFVKNPDREKIVLAMDNGVIWVNGRKSPGVREAAYEVRTTNMMVRAKGTVFEVESDTAQVVRVMDGEVSVDIYVTVEGKERVAETMSVGVGQEIVLDQAALRAFADNRRPSILMAISDSFKEGEWYKWNISEDRNPTSYALRSAEMLTEMEATPAAEPADDADGYGLPVTLELDSLPEAEETMPEEGKIAPPAVLKPAPSDRMVSGGIVTISGTAAKGTARIAVEQVIKGNNDSYNLSRFKAGDTSWTYNVAEQYGNLEEGDNTYSFYAYDDKGEKSTAARVTITYDKQKAEITDKLEAPVVLKFNGASSAVVTAAEVLVEGSVKGAQSVVVNGYALSRFVAGGTTWSYWAKESLGNLKPGENSYEVYALGSDGAKSEVVKFTINYEKAAAAQTAPSQPVGSAEPEYSF